MSAISCGWLSKKEDRYVNDDEVHAQIVTTTTSSSGVNDEWRVYKVYGIDRYKSICQLTS